MLMYPAPLVQAFLESFESLHEWREIFPHEFVHPKGLRVKIDVFSTGTGDVSILYDDLTMRLPSPFVAPVMKPKQMAVVVGTLVLGTTKVSALVFQNALHQQWGLGALERLQALSHVLAKALDLPQGLWYDNHHDDDFSNHHGTIVSSPYPMGHVCGLLRHHNLCVMNTQGCFFPPKSIPLQLYSSAHEQLRHADHIQWAEEVLSVP